jgi:hypothetical protein
MATPRASRPHMPGYGSGGPTQGSGLLPWSWAEQRLLASRNYWVATSWPDGRPHVMPVWGVWHDGAHPAGKTPPLRVAADQDDPVTADAHRRHAVRGSRWWVRRRVPPDAPVLTVAGDHQVVAVLGDLIHFDAGPEAGLVVRRAVLVEVFDTLAADVGARSDARAGLLPDLAGQGLLQGLAGLDGAAGKRPVGAVPGDQDDLGAGGEADAERLGGLRQRRAKGRVEPPDAVARPISHDGLHDPRLDGHGLRAASRRSRRRRRSSRSRRHPSARRCLALEERGSCLRSRARPL